MPKRVDMNQREIVRELRTYPGVAVQSLADMGSGCPDLLCGHACINWLFEVKNPNQPPSKRRLTFDEKVWHFNWSGQVAIIETAEDALRLMGVIE